MTYRNAIKTDIGKYTQSPLTHEQVVELAKTIELATYAQHLLSTEELTREYRTQLQQVIAEGELAIKQLCVTNFRLVYKIVRSYSKLNQDVPFQDLLQEGMCGLLTAIWRYDYQKGFRFSTYATNWIKNFILAYLNQTTRSTVRLPANKYSEFRKMWNYINQHIDTYGTPPTLGDIESHTGWDTQTVTLIKNIGTYPMVLEAANIETLPLPSVSQPVDLDLEDSSSPLVVNATSIMECFQPPLTDSEYGVLCTMCCSPAVRGAEHVGGLSHKQLMAEQKRLLLRMRQSLGEAEQVRLCSLLKKVPEVGVGLC